MTSPPPSPQAVHRAPRANLAAMRLTVPHYYRLPMAKDLDDAASWDELRATSSAFAVPQTRAEWERTADARPEFLARAEDVAAVARRLDARVVASYGVGAALVERHLVGRVDRLVCGDFTPVAIQRVRELMPDADVRLHDLSEDPPFQADLHLLHRVDTEFSDVQWRAILQRFAVPC